MYVLKFKKNNSKHFQTVIDFAKELNAEVIGDSVIINIPEHLLLDSYDMIRTIFGFIQNWKGTAATYKGKSVHPYQFILSTYRIRECSEISSMDKTNCNSGNSEFGWSCKKINNIIHKIGGTSRYKDNNKYWYNFGHFKGKKWVIDKDKLYDKLFMQVNSEGIDLCPIFDSEKLKLVIADLPEFIVPDDISFRIHYEEKSTNGNSVLIPTNIRHINKIKIPYKKSYDKEETREGRNIISLHGFKRLQEHYRE